MAEAKAIGEDYLQLEKYANLNYMVGWRVCVCGGGEGGGEDTARGGMGVIGGGLGLRTKPQRLLFLM